MTRKADQDKRTAQHIEQSMQKWSRGAIDSVDIFAARIIFCKLVSWLPSLPTFSSAMKQYAPQTPHTPFRIDNAAMKQYTADLRAAEAETGRWTWDPASGYYYNAQHGWDCHDSARFHSTADRDLMALTFFGEQLSCLHKPGPGDNPMASIGQTLQALWVRAFMGRFSPRVFLLE